MSGGTYHQPSVELHSLRSGKPVADFTLDDWLSVGRLSVTENLPDYPLFLLCYSQQIGKPISEFTEDDWRRAAISAGWLIEELTEKAYPTMKPSLPKTLGRPPKNRNAFAVRLKEMTKRDPWRPSKLWFGKLSPSEFNEIIANLMADGIKHRQKRSKRFYIRTLMRVMKEKTGIPEDLLNLESALRDKRRKKREK